MSAYTDYEMGGYTQRDREIDRVWAEKRIAEQEKRARESAAFALFCGMLGPIGHLK